MVGSGCVGSVADSLLSRSWFASVSGFALLCDREAREPSVPEEDPIRIASTRALNGVLSDRFLAMVSSSCEWLRGGESEVFGKLEGVAAGTGTGTATGCEGPVNRPSTSPTVAR